MASENVELVRSIYADWERGDYRSAEWAHPDIEFAFADGAPRGSWKGLSEMAKAWLDYISAFQELRFVADECRELDDGRVLVLGRQYGRGKMSGLELEEIQAKGASVFEIRDGKVTRLVVYEDCDRALADLGLEE
jgi:ketosteroid isomerase-like protein